MVTFYGKWVVKVVQKDADWDQQVVINGSANADGVHPGNVGESFTVDGERPWNLTIQHNDGTGWADSLIKESLASISGTKISFSIFSEDMVNNPDDWNDLVLELIKIGPIISVPYRPYAIRMDTFQMMPDGIFDTFLGTYYMGVPIKNIWGADFPPDQMIDVTQTCRDILALQGIRVIDSWESRELESFGQKLNGRRVIIGRLKKFQIKTVYFKIDCSQAKPNKFDVEFECIRPSMLDPNSPDRKASRKIFVTKSHYDSITREMVCECPEGRLRMKLHKVLIDKASARKAIKRVRKRVVRRPISYEDLDRALKEIEKGRKIDICRLLKILKCDCECSDIDRTGNYKFICNDFFVWPLEFSYSVETSPYIGKYSPLPFEDPWWKVLLVILAVILWIAGAISEAESLAYHDDDIVIGTLERWQQNDVDAAICLLNGNRSLPTGSPFHYLDAQTGEVSTIPLEAMDSEIEITGATMSNDDIDEALATGDIGVFKSGARTGLTHGLLGSPHPPYTRDDDNTVFSIPQVTIHRDTSLPMAIRDRGDSGSVWIHKSTRKILALHHSGADDYAIASRIEDVMRYLNIRFM